VPRAVESFSHTPVYFLWRISTKIYRVVRQ
jgi:hypothetical protein